MSVPKKHPELFALMEEGVSQNVFPGGVLWVQHRGKTVHASAHGILSLHPPGKAVTLSTCFDLASLTKVLATAPVLLLLLQKEMLSLDTKVSEILPAFKGHSREEITLFHLCEHSSGLPAWKPYFQNVEKAVLTTREGKEAVRTLVLQENPEDTPGTRAIYSDLGFILLDWVIERATGKMLDDLFCGEIARPLGLKNLFFIDLKNGNNANQARRGRSFAATERCPWRGRIVAGEVHDENAYAMGGVSGHAGLFGDAESIALLAQEWLDAFRGEGKFFSPLWVKTFWKRSDLPGSTRALCFDTKSERDSQAGDLFGANTVGHLGFTGTSLWIDPDKELLAVLLCNRIHPTRENETIKRFRPRLHDQVALCLKRETE
jgi:serine-type D-Ala-D-Ala carboxypeptidase